MGSGRNFILSVLAGCRKSGRSRGILTASPEARKGFRGYKLGFSDKLLGGPHVQNDVEVAVDGE